ncbi:MAG: amidohydrolase [Gammaproteobacteria bacterium]|nr:amidohydrolase [Gammaproteobacteria bacterium]MDH3467311.1 amidohydrolase [Gammaproteobacteria bacterium]
MAKAAVKTTAEEHYQAVAASHRSDSKKTAKEFFVIDADRHVIEPPEALTKYLDEEFEKEAPKLVTDNQGSPRIMMEGRLYQKPRGYGGGRLEGCGDQRPRGESLPYEEAYKHSLTYRDEDMDMGGVDIGIWFPTMGLFIPDIINLELQYALARAYNDWMVNDFATNRRHIWCATIPLKPEWAVEEIKRCHKLGATAVWMRPNVMNNVHYWEESWDQVWKTMTDLGMALLFHEATGTYNATYSTDYKYDKYWLAHVVSHPCEMATGMCGLIGYGVLERHPTLQVLFCEAGATWVPYFLFRMDEHVAGRPRSETAELTIDPSEYFRRQCTICSFEPAEALLQETVQWFSGRNMGLTSDYPHWDSSGVSGVEMYIELYPDMEEWQRERFFSRNVIDALNLQP